MTFFIPVHSLASFIIKVIFFYDPCLRLWYSALCCCHILNLPFADQDALTDLTGDSERLPVEEQQGTWLGHKVRN